MRTAMSSAGLGASVVSRVLQAWVTGSWLMISRVPARRVMPVLISAARLSTSPSVYRTRVLCRGTCTRVAWYRAPGRPVPRGRPGGRPGNVARWRGRGRGGGGGAGPALFHSPGAGAWPAQMQGVPVSSVVRARGTLLEGGGGGAAGRGVGARGGG